MDRIIFHIDVNSAYLSWSAIDLLQANPDSVDIRTIPPNPSAATGRPAMESFWQSLCQRKILTISTAEPVANALKNVRRSPSFPLTTTLTAALQQTVCRFSALSDIGN